MSWRWCRISIGREIPRVQDTFRSAASASCSSTRARPTRRWHFSSTISISAAWGPRQPCSMSITSKYCTVRRAPRTAPTRWPGSSTSRARSRRDTFGGRAEFDVGDYNERSYGAVLTGPVSALDSAFRLAVQHYTSDGFYDNAYLGRSNDRRRDELTVRGKWRYEPNDDWRVDLTLLRVADRQWLRRLDHRQQPHHANPTNRASMASIPPECPHARTYSGFAPTTLTTIATYADTTVNYGYRRRLGQS